MEDKKYTQWFWVLNFGFLFFRLLYIGLPQLAPQEAYYWNYSRHLALSYFDHPPVHAWLIFLSTRLGISEFTVRLFAPLCAFGTAYFCFLTGKLLFNARVAFYFVLTLNAILIFNIGSVILTPDVPLLFFWALTFYLFAKLAITGNGRLWYPLGFCLGLAMLSKYTAIFIPISILLFLLVSKEQRFWFLRKEPYLAVLLAVLAFLPVLIWNAQNEWVSFAFQTSRRAAELGGISLRDFFAYLGSQIGVLSPLIYGMMIYTLVQLGIEIIRKRRFTARSEMTSPQPSPEGEGANSPLPNPPLRGEGMKEGSADLLLLCWSVPIILFFTMVSFKYWVKMNWPAPGYVPAILAGVALLLNENKSKEGRK